MATPLTAREIRAHELVDALTVAEALRQKLERYHTTATSCNCPDFRYRGPGSGKNLIGACAHILALRLLAEREKDKP